MMKFFTTPYGPWPYHLVSYEVWKKGYNKEYKELIIDCGVNSLVGKKEYPYIGEYPLEVDGNMYWVCPDYPFDLGPDLTQKECKEKSLRNILKWNLCKNVICSVQYRYEDYYDLQNEYKRLYPHAQIIGIGNLCKSRNMVFLKRVISYILHHNPSNKWIHFFGLYKPAIKYLAQFRLPFEVSVDSMKWDYGLHTDRTGDKNTKRARWYNFLSYYKDILSENKQEILRCR